MQKQRLAESASGPAAAHGGEDDGNADGRPRRRFGHRQALVLPESVHCGRPGRAPGVRTTDTLRQVLRLNRLPVLKGVGVLRRHGVLRRLQRRSYGRCEHTPVLSRILLVLYTLLSQYCTR